MEVLRDHRSVTLDYNSDKEDTEEIDDILAQISAILYEAEEKGIIKSHNMDWMFNERVDHEYNE